MSAFMWNVLLALAWTAMTGSMTPGNFALGAVIGFTALMFTRHVPGLPHYSQRGWAIITLGVWTLWEILLANLRVTRDLLRPHNIHPALIRFDTRVVGDFQMTMLAALITLTPGSTVVDVSEDDRQFLVHFTNLPPGGVEEARDSIRNGFERRVMEVFK